MSINANHAADTEQLYFAYGSNLNLPELRRALANEGISEDAVSPVMPAQLPDYMLAFNYYSFSRRGGALNVVSSRGRIVTGYLFRLTPEAWTLIDRKEGHPSFYRRTRVMVIDNEGEYVPALTYIVTPENEQDFTPPTDQYLQICIEGRKSLNIEHDSVAAASNNKTNGAILGLFCYGTLMRGESRFSALRLQKTSCALLAEILGRLLDCGAYPGLVPARGQHVFVEGEFFIFTKIDKVLEELDVIEGFEDPLSTNNLYRRTIMEVCVGDGRVRTAWVYLLCNEDFPELAPQHWRRSQGRADAAYERIVDLHASANPEHFYQRMTNLLNRWVVDENNPPPLLDRAAVIAGVTEGEISERKMAQASGVWTVGFGSLHAW